MRDGPPHRELRPLLFSNSVWVLLYNTAVRDIFDDNSQPAELYGEDRTGPTSNEFDLGNDEVHVPDTNLPLNNTELADIMHIQPLSASNNYGVDRVSRKLRPRKLRPQTRKTQTLGCLENSHPKNSDPHSDPKNSDPRVSRNLRPKKLRNPRHYQNLLRKEKQLIVLDTCDVHENYLPRKEKNSLQCEIRATIMEIILNIRIDFSFRYRIHNVSCH